MAEKNLLSIDRSPETDPVDLRHRVESKRAERERERDRERSPSSSLSPPLKVRLLSPKETSSDWLPAEISVRVFCLHVVGWSYFLEFPDFTIRTVNISTDTRKALGIQSFTHVDVGQN